MFLAILVIYSLIYFLLLFKFKIKPIKNVNPLGIISEKYRKVVVLIIALLFMSILFSKGNIAAFIFFMLTLAYVLQYKNLQKEKAKYHTLLNMILFAIFTVFSIVSPL